MTCSSVSAALLTGGKSKESSLSVLLENSLDLNFVFQMIDVFATNGTPELLLQLNALLEQELRYQPKLSGLRTIESAHDNGLRMTARLRDFEVKDLLSLIQFFGFRTETFSLAVNYLDRFLSKMKVGLYEVTV